MILGFSSYLILRFVFLVWIVTMRYGFHFLQASDLCVFGPHWSSFMVVVLGFQIKLWLAFMGCSKSLSWILTSRFSITLRLGGDLASRLSESFDLNVIGTRFKFFLLGLLGSIWNLSLLCWFGKKKKHSCWF